MFVPFSSLSLPSVVSTLPEFPRHVGHVGSCAHSLIPRHQAWPVPLLCSESAVPWREMSVMGASEPESAHEGRSLVLVIILSPLVSLSHSQIQMSVWGAWLRQLRFLGQVMYCHYGNRGIPMDREILRRVVIITGCFTVVVNTQLLIISWPEELHDEQSVWQPFSRYTAFYEGDLCSGLFWVS